MSVLLWCIFGCQLMVALVFGVFAAFSSFGPIPSPASVPAAVLKTIDDATKNVIWWEVEQSVSEVTELFERRTESVAKIDVIAVMQECDKEVRARIAQKYGLTYQQVKQIHNEVE